MPIPEGTGSSDGLGRVVTRKSDHYIVIDSPNKDDIGKNVNDTETPVQMGADWWHTHQPSHDNGSESDAYESTNNNSTPVANAQAEAERLEQLRKQRERERRLREAEEAFDAEQGLIPESNDLQGDFSWDYCITVNRNTPLEDMIDPALAQTIENNPDYVLDVETVEAFALDMGFDIDEEDYETLEQYWNDIRELTQHLRDKNSAPDNEVIALGVAQRLFRLGESLPLVIEGNTLSIGDSTDISLVVRPGVGGGRYSGMNYSGVPHFGLDIDIKQQSEGNPIIIIMGGSWGDNDKEFSIYDRGPSPYAQIPAWINAVDATGLDYIVVPYPGTIGGKNTNPQDAPTLYGKYNQSVNAFQEINQRIEDGAITKTTPIIILGYSSGADTPLMFTHDYQGELNISSIVLLGPTLSGGHPNYPVASGEASWLEQEYKLEILRTLVYGTDVIVIDDTGNHADVREAFLRIDDLIGQFSYCRVQLEHYDKDMEGDGTNNNENLIIDIINNQVNQTKLQFCK